MGLQPVPGDDVLPGPDLQLEDLWPLLQYQVGARGTGVSAGGAVVDSSCPGTANTCSRAASPADVPDSSLGAARMPSMTHGR